MGVARLFGGLSGLENRDLNRQRGPQLAAGLSLKGHPDYCSCLHRRCDFSGWLEEGEAAEDPMFFVKDGATVVIARVQRRVSSP